MAAAAASRRDIAALRVGKAQVSRKLKAIKSDLENLRFKIARLAREKKFQEIFDEEQKMRKLVAKEHNYTRLIDLLDERMDGQDLACLFGILGALNRGMDSSVDSAIAQVLRDSSSGSSFGLLDERDASRFSTQLSECMSESDYVEYQEEQKRQRSALAPPSKPLIDF